MESRLKEMSLITGDGKLKKITNKCCKDCENFTGGIIAKCKAVGTEKGRPTAMNDTCGCFKGKEKKNGNFNDDTRSDRGSERV